MAGFEIGLKCHLLKSELEYYAKMRPEGSRVDWLVQHCNSLREVESFLRYLGFRIRNVEDGSSLTGEKKQWVETSNGVIVYVNSRDTLGFVAKAPKK